MPLEENEPDGTQEAEGSTDDGGEPRREVLRSTVDPLYDCVPIDSQTPDGNIAEPPPDGIEQEGQSLCPDGYVPRLRRRDYGLSGKQVITGKPPERRPD